MIVIRCVCLFSFAACGEEKDKRIELTTANYETYISVDSVKVYGSGMNFISNGEYWYYGSTAYASVSGVMIYQYINVTITVYMSIGSHDYKIPLTMNLNICGSASASNSIDLDDVAPTSWMQDGS